VKLLNEFIRRDHCSKLGWRFQCHGDARLRGEIRGPVEGLDEKRVNPVAQAPGACGERRTEGMDESGRITSLFLRLAGACFGRVFPALGSSLPAIPR
jgi:hypothetical protein